MGVSPSVRAHQREFRDSSSISPLHILVGPVTEPELDWVAWPANELQGSHPLLVLVLQTFAQTLCSAISFFLNLFIYLLDF